MTWDLVKFFPSNVYILNGLGILLWLCFAPHCVFSSVQSWYLSCLKRETNVNVTIIRCIRRRHCICGFAMFPNVSWPRFMSLFSRSDKLILFPEQQQQQQRSDMFVKTISFERASKFDAFFWKQRLEIAQYYKSK